jgi:GTPase SAR1 family protein
MEINEMARYRAALGNAFTPSAPVSRLDLFSGRADQLSRITDVVFQRGQHAVVYGERGVGKTSLANVLADWLNFLKKHNYQVIRHNCAATSTFNTIWEGVFRELSFKRNATGLVDSPSTIPMSSYVPANAGSEDVRFLLQQIGSSTIVIIDEYDRVKDTATHGLLADTIKGLSDHAVDATLIIIGVADSIDELISEHRSIERALVQIHMPRMSNQELLAIVDKGFSEAAMRIRHDAKQHIATLSQGLPHNTHELGLLSGQSALERDDTSVEKIDVEAAIKRSVNNAQQTIVTSYTRAISSPHNNNNYKEILLAAALAVTDDLGYFAAGDLRAPLAAITSKTYGIDSYMRHLNLFCEAPRGSILQRKGERRRYRFRFSESIMEPYVIMKGIADGLMSEEAVVEFESRGMIGPTHP